MHKVNIGTSTSNSNDQEPNRGKDHKRIYLLWGPGKVATGHTSCSCGSIIYHLFI